MATKRDSTTVARPGAAELDERELDTIAGGAGSGELASARHTATSKWKMASFDGKGNDVLSEELFLVSESIDYKRGV